MRTPFPQSSFLVLARLTSTHCRPCIAAGIGGSSQVICTTIIPAFVCPPDTCGCVAADWSAAGSSCGAACCSGLEPGIGLRLEEAITLSWDEDAGLAIDLSGKHPRLRISGGSQKSGKDQLLPLVPDFAQWLLRTPEDERVGPVFRIIGLETGEPISSKQVSRLATKIGKRAGIVVNREMKRIKEDVIDPTTGDSTGRTHLVLREVITYASCHDLRRSFGTRWAKKLMPATLKLLSSKPLS